MRRIAIINQKGGVGKTTSAVNLGAALAAAGERVLLIDLDPQAHATLHLGIAPGREDPSIYHVLSGDTSLADARREVQPNLWVAGADIDLAAAEVELAGVVGRDMILRDKLESHLAEAEGGELYDFVLIDCPPSLGVLTINALTAADEVILPLQPHFLALHGVSKLLDTIELVARRLNNRLRLTGIVLCMYDASTRLAGEVCHDVEEFFAQATERRTSWSSGRVFATRIRRNIRLAEAPSFGQTIFDYAPDSHGAADYTALAAEVANMDAAADAKLASAARHG